MVASDVDIPLQERFVVWALHVGSGRYPPLSQKDLVNRVLGSGIMYVPLEQG